MPAPFVSPPPAFNRLPEPARSEASLAIGRAGAVQVDEDLVVRAPTQSIDPIGQTITFSNGVTATYGVTTIRADRLFVDKLHESARAEGHVHVDDPDGIVDADNLQFTWMPGAQTGHAENVSALVAGATVRAKTADITPGHWIFLGVAFTSCRRSTPLYLVSANRLDVYPGKEGRLSRPSVSLFGHKLLTIPSYKFSLDPRAKGIRPPTISYRRGVGYGVAFDSGIMLSDNTSISGNFGVFPDTLPGYGVQLTRSWVPIGRSQHLIAPRSDLGERFDFGYLENLEVVTPEDERSFLTGPRNSVSVASAWNQGSPRIDNRDFSKLIEVTYERGGKAGPLDVLSQARFETIREDSGPFMSRMLLYGSGLLPKVKLGKNLDSLTRFDMSLYLGHNQFGWARGLFGAVYHPLPQAELSAGWAQAFEGGTPDFSIDPLISRSALHLRADVNLGPTRLGYLTKYDRQLGWYDREYYASQVVGCLEAFVLYRKNPSDYKLGITLRLDQFVDVLTRRKFDRNQSTGRKGTSGGGR